MQAELEQPLELFQRNLAAPRASSRIPTARPTRTWCGKAREYGYVAAFTVRREGNPSFVLPSARAPEPDLLRRCRSPDFAKNLNVFHDEELK